MGGIIALTIRKKDGTVHRTSCWTNWLPGLLNNYGIKDESHFDEYLNLIAKEEATGKGKGKGKVNYYSSEPFLSPSEYGLIVVDYMTNELVHANHYTSFGELYYYSILNAAHHNGDNDLLEGFKQKDPTSEASNLRVLLEAKQLIKVTGFDESSESIVDLPYSSEYLNNLTIEEFVKKFFPAPDHRALTRFYFKLGVFKITRYEKDVEGFTQLKAHITRLGFEFTEYEEKIWDRYLNPVKAKDEDE